MTAEEKAICVAWVKAHAHKWQVQNRAQWTYKFRGKALVRYVKESQMRENEIKLILEYLCSDDCIETLSLYDQSVSADWKPIRAWLELTNEAVGNVRSVRLYHGLRTDPNSDADGPYLVEDGCAYKVHLTYYWSQPSVIQVPAGSSGVSYQITSLSRDQETGLYTYALEKRERVQQDIAEYFTEKTVYETRQEEQHIGVKQSKVSTTGKQASVGGGKIIQRKLSKNQDCTTDVANTTITEVGVKGAEKSVRKLLHGIVISSTDKNQNQALDTTGKGLNVGEERKSVKTPGGLYDNSTTNMSLENVGEVATACEKTIFQHEDSSTENVAEKPEPEVDSASGGVLHSQTARQTEYGTWDVQTNTTTELSVPSSIVRTHKSLRGVTQTVVNRNQAAPLSTTGLAIGEDRQSEKTPGGLYNNTLTTRTNENVGEIGVSCSTTALDHTDSTTTNIANKPANTHTSSAGGGHIYQKTSRQTEEGTWDVSETHKQEIVVGNMGEEKRVTPHGYYETKKYRSHDSAVNASGVGSSGSSRITEGGLYEKSETVFTCTGGAGDKGSADNALDTTNSTTTIAKKQDTSTASGGGGKIVQKKSHQNEDGTWENTTITTTEKLVKIGEEKRVTSHGTFTTNKYRDTSSTLDKVKGVGSSGSSRITEGGLFEKEETTFEIKATEDINERTKTKGYETTTTRNVKDKAQDISISVNKNEKKEKSNALNADGTWNYTEITTTFNQQKGSSETKYATETAKTTYTTYDENVNPTVDSENGSTSVSLNEYGTGTVSKTEVTPIEKDSGWITWDSETKGVRYTYKYHHGLRIFINKKECPKPDKGSNVSIRVSINRYGLYEGSMSYEDLYDWEITDAGNNKGGGVKTGTVKWYEYKVSETSGKPQKRECYGHVVHYHGTGNEDAEATDAVKSIGVIGIHWGARMYCTNVTYGAWVDDDKNKTSTNKTTTTTT